MPVEVVLMPALVQPEALNHRIARHEQASPDPLHHGGDSKAPAAATPTPAAHPSPLAAAVAVLIMSGLALLLLLHHHALCHSPRMIKDPETEYPM